MPTAGTEFHYPQRHPDRGGRLVVPSDPECPKQRYSIPAKYHSSRVSPPLGASTLLIGLPPRRCELIVIRRYSPPCTTARRGGCVIKENLAKPPKQTKPGWFSFWIHRKTTPAWR